MGSMGQERWDSAVPSVVTSGGTRGLYKAPVPSLPPVHPAGSDTTAVSSPSVPGRLRIALVLVTPAEGRDRGVRRLRAALKGLLRCYGLRCVRCDFTEESGR